MCFYALSRVVVARAAAAASAAGEGVGVGAGVGAMYKCNVRSAKRGKRMGEGKEKIGNNVKVRNLKSSAQKLNPHWP